MDTPRADQITKRASKQRRGGSQTQCGSVTQSRKATGIPALLRTVHSLKHVTGVRIFPMNIFVTETAEHGTVSGGGGHQCSPFF